MTTEIKSCICPKCGGAGILDWTDNDGGICYKCEGRGYLGELPKGFIKCNRKEAREQAKLMVKKALYNLRMKGESYCIPSYEFYPETIKALLEKSKVFRFNYSKFWMNQPSMTFEFGGDSEYAYKVIVGGEYLIIKPKRLTEED